jgi:hypothetical protein
MSSTAEDIRTSYAFYRLLDEVLDVGCTVLLRRDTERDDRAFEIVECRRHRERGEVEIVDRYDDTDRQYIDDVTLRARIADGVYKIHDVTR